MSGNSPLCKYPYSKFRERALRAAAQVGRGGRWRRAAANVFARVGGESPAAASPAPAPARPGRRMPRFRCALLAAFALLAALAGYAPGAAAQVGDPVVLVKNTGQTGSSNVKFGWNGPIIAAGQRIRTGPNPSGYLFHQVSVYFEYTNRHNLIDMEVSIWKAGHNYPTDKVYTLSRNGGLDDWSWLNWHAAKPAEAVLSPNTDYFIVFDCQNGTCENGRNRIDLDVTGSDSEDAGGQSGWSIADNSIIYNHNDNGQWGFLNNSGASDVIRISAKGWANQSTYIVENGVRVVSTPSTTLVGDAYVAGDVIAFEVEFADSVYLRSNISDADRPRLRFKIGDVTRSAVYTGGSGTKKLRFEYTVVAADHAPGGIWVGDNLDTWENALGEIRYQTWTRPALLDHDALGTLRGHPVRNDASDCDAIWCAALNVLDLGSRGYGCYNSPYLWCSDTSLLSNDTFTHDSTGYSVTRARVSSSGRLNFRVSPNLTAGSRSLQLHVGDEIFRFDEADSKPANERFWDNAGLSWSADDRIILKLTEAPPSTNASLSALALSYDDSGTDTAISLTPAFASGTLSYTASVGNAVDRITVAPAADHYAATVEYFDGNDDALADADSNKDDHQVALAVGANTIKVKVTAEDGNTVQTYSVTVSRETTDDDASLSALALSYDANGTETAIALTPTFASETLSYAASAGNAVDEITVAPTTAHGEATVEYLDGDDAAIADADDGKAGRQVALAVGANTIKVKVTAEDGNTVQTYTVTVTRAGSADASLSALALTDATDDSAITLTPAFTSGTLSYAASAGNAVDRITVAPATAHGEATVEYLDGDGAAISDADGGKAGHQVTLAVGANTIKVKVTAEDGNTVQTYTVTVTRAACDAIWCAVLIVKNLGADGFGCYDKPGRRCSNPSLLSEDTFTHDSTGYSVTRARVSPTGRLNFRVSPNLTAGSRSLQFHVGDEIFRFDEADSKPANERFWDNAGLSWSAGDRIYLRLNEAPPSTDASLSALALSYDDSGTDTAIALTPTFTSGTLSYAASAGNAVDKITVAPATTHGEATVEYLDSDNAAIADADDGKAGHQVALAVGANAIKVKVTAEDGNTVQTYTVTVTRAGSADASLSALALTNAYDDSAIALTPAFTSGTLSYAASAGNAVDRITVAPATAHGEATVEYLDGDGAAISDADGGKAGHQVTLAVGANTIKVKVTAEDGNTVQTYTVTVTRAACDAIWCAVLIVKNLGADGLGCYDKPGRRCSNPSLLSEDTFTHDSTGYSVTRARVSPTGRLNFRVSPNLTAGSWSLQFHVGDEIFRFDEADSKPANERFWDNAGLSWSAGDRIYLRLNEAPPSTDASLSALALSYDDSGTDTAIALTPTFASETLSYAASAGNAVDKITVAPATTHGEATVEYLDSDNAAIADADDGKAGHQVALAVGANAIKVKVTAEDGNTVQTYTVTVTRAGSADASLSALALTNAYDDSAIALTPAFTSGTLSYAASAGNAVDRITVAPATAHGEATVEYLDGDDAAISDADGGKAGHQVTLAVGANTIKVKVTAEDGSTVQTYTVTVTRAACDAIWCAVLIVKNLGADGLGCYDKPGRRCSNPSLLSEDTFTHDSTGYSVTRARVSPTGRLNFRVSPNLTAGSRSLQFHVGDEIFRFDEADSKPANERFWDNAGLSWSAGDRIYLRLNEAPPSTDASLSALALSYDDSGTDTAIALTPTFTSGTLSYAASAGNAVDKITVAPATTHGEATVEYLDSDNAAIADADDGKAGHQVALAVGANAIKVKVTAEDGNTVQTYTVTVTRAGSADASLSALALTNAYDDSAIALTPTFTSGTLSYAASAGNAVDRITVAPATTHGEATVEYLDGDDAAISDADGGKAGHQVTLAVGANAIKVKVTAEDGNTVQTYTVTATRNTVATGKPAISGPARVGATLTAAKGTIADADGTAKADNGDTGYAYTYQWVRVDGADVTDIAGATSGAYTLAAADIGKTVKVEVSFKDDAGYAEEPLVSDAYPASGTVLSALTLTASFTPAMQSVLEGGMVNVTIKIRASQAPGDTLEYRPYTINGTAIGTDDFTAVEPKQVEAPASEFSPQDDGSHVYKRTFELSTLQDAILEGDETFYFGIARFALRSGGDFTATVEGDVNGALIRILDDENTVATGKPAISGRAQTGATLTAARGTVADADGLPATFPDDYSLQWVRVDADGVSNPADIAGATTGAYTPAAADVGKKIKVEVSFTDGAGNTETLTSDAYPTTGTVTATPSDDDASLSALALSYDANGTDTAIALTPTFASETLSYTASAGNAVDEITVAPTTVHYAATVEYLDGDDAAISDADDGKAGHQVALAVGANAIKVKVTAEDGNTVQTYTVTVTRAACDAIWCAVLIVKNLGADGFGCYDKPGRRCSNPSLLSEDTFTHDSTGYSVTRARVNPTGRLNFRVSPNLTAGSRSLQFHVGDEIFRFDEADSKPANERFWDNAGLSWSAGDRIYLRLTEAPPSTDASLSALALSYDANGTDTAIALIPTFASETLSYAASVGNAVDKITIAPTTTHSEATVEYFDGNDDALADADSNKDDPQVALAVGANAIKVKVTAEDGVTVQTYTVTVTRAGSADASLSALALSYDANGTDTAISLTPTFTSGTLSYAASAGNAVDEITVAPATAHGEATVEYLDGDSGAISDADSTEAGHQVALAVGANAIKVKVTAEDGNTVQTYAVTVTRAGSADASLSALALTDASDDSAIALTPTFTSGTLSYAASAGNAVDEITVAPATAHGEATVEYLDGDSGAISDADSTEAGHQVALAVGANTIKVKVTAEDGSTVQTYTVTVTRAGSADASLSALALSYDESGTDTAIALTPTFTSETLSYAASAGNAVDEITVAPATAHGEATVEYLDGDSGAISDADSTEAGHQVALAVGANTIKVKVTAEDGVTEETYTVVVTRAAAGACPAGNDWCETLTVGTTTTTPPGTFYGFIDSLGIGALSNPTITYAGINYGITLIGINDFNTGTDEVAIGADLYLPRGSVFNLGGTEFTANATSETGNGNYEWSRPSGFTWTAGQTVTVSVKFPDTTAPTVSSAAVNGTELTVTFSENLAAAASLANSAFTVKKTPSGGSEQAVSLTGSPTISGNTVMLTLAQAAAHTDTVKVSYAKPTSGSNNKLKDAADNEVASFTDQPVTNDTADDVSPTLVSLAASGTRVFLTYDEALDPSSVPVANAYRVTANGGNRTVSNVSVDGEIVLLTLTSSVAVGQSVRVRYTKPAANPVQDLVGNDAANFDRTETAGLNATLSAVDYTFDENSQLLYRFDLVLTEAVAIGFRHMRDAAFTVANGTMVRAKRLDKATRGGRVVASQWRMTVRADTRSRSVTVSLPANRPCGQRGAICTAGGARLANAPSLTLSTATVAGNVVPTLSIADTSAVENAAALSFTITLSSPPRSDVKVDFETLTTGTATANTDYAATSRTILIPAGNRTWDAAVALIQDTDDDPDETVKVQISNARAIEHDGRPIVPLTITDGEATGTIAAPVTTIGNLFGVTMTIEDTEADESDGWLRFDVTLSQPLDDYVCYDFETLTTGTATPEDDFGPRPKHTLWMWPGQVADRPFVRIYEDSLNDGGETVKVKISNARLCEDPSRRINFVQAEATGTIKNDDPMLRAWLARFGRTVAEQAVDAVESRIRSAPRPGIEMTLVGQRIGAGAAAEPRDGAPGKAAREAETQARLADVSRWLRNETADDSRTGAQAVSPDEILVGSSFSLTSGSDGPGGGVASLWGRGAQTSFDGREGADTVSGDVTSLMLGADWTRGSGSGSWTAGLMLSHSRGEGSYRGASDGKLSSAITGLYPYGRYALNDRVTVWGTAGYGAGTLTLTPEDGEPYETDMDLAMAAVGLRGVVVRAPAGGGPELAVKTDAMTVRTSSDGIVGRPGGNGNLAAEKVGATRLRLGLEGTWKGVRLGAGTLEPRLEVGLRQDGGDAETGFGLDLGGGLGWSDPETGIRAEVSGRGLLTHESAGFRQRGFAGSLGWDPRPGSARGPSLTLRQTLGVSASGGADALLNRGTLEGLAANDDGNELDRRRLELTLGYGFAAFGDRFTSVPELGFGMSEGHREYSLGWRLKRDLRPGDIGSLEFGFEGRRREAANDNTGAPPEHTVGIRVTARF